MQSGTDALNAEQKSVKNESMEVKAAVGALAADESNAGVRY